MSYEVTSAMGQTNPASDGVHHCFPPNFWDEVGYSWNALPDNRRGRLAEGQEILFMGDAFRAGLCVLFVLGAMYALLAVLANRSKFDPFGFLALIGLSVAFGAVFSFLAIGMLRDLTMDWVRRQVVSFCGELTGWTDSNDEGSDSHGLEHQSHRVRTTAQTWSALPKRAHYRIYFTPRGGNVINAEEHTDEAPHVWPRTS